MDAWAWVFRKGPCAMLDTLLDEINPKLDEKTRGLIRAFVEGWRDQAEWIERTQADLRSECARVREIGESMRRAGLRSYTDKEGRIYVAPTDT